MRLPIKTDLNTKDLLWVYDCMWTILCVCVCVCVCGGGETHHDTSFLKSHSSQRCNLTINNYPGWLTLPPFPCGRRTALSNFPEPLYCWSQIKWQWVTLRRSLRAEQGGDNGITLMIPNCIMQRARGQRTDTDDGESANNRVRSPGGWTVSFPVFYSLDTRMNMQLFNRVKRSDP